MKVADTAEAAVLVYKITCPITCPKRVTLIAATIRTPYLTCIRLHCETCQTPLLQWSNLFVLVPNSYHCSHTFELTFIFCHSNKCVLKSNNGDESFKKQHDLTKYQVIMRYCTNSTNSLKFWHSCTCILLLLHITSQIYKICHIHECSGWPCL